MQTLSQYLPFEDTNSKPPSSHDLGGIEAMFNDPDTEFVLVGAAHLVGADGLVELLRARGYDISKL